MSGLHYGRLPTDQRVLKEIRGSQELGFRTILLREFQELEARGVYLEDFELFMEPQTLPIAQKGE